jgi:putative membrane protein
MWICLTLFGTIDGPYTAWLFITAGLIFSLVNAIVKPIATLLALPLILLTMGIFVIILNTAMVGLTVWLLPNVHMTFWGAILSSFVLGLINYLVNLLVPAYNKR